MYIPFFSVYVQRNIGVYAYTLLTNRIRIRYTVYIMDKKIIISARIPQALMARIDKLGFPQRSRAVHYALTKLCTEREAENTTTPEKTPRK